MSTPSPTARPNVLSGPMSGNEWYGIAASRPVTAGVSRVARRPPARGRARLWLRVDPAAVVLDEVVGVGRAHGALAVQDRGGRVFDDALDDAPLLGHAVAAAEPAAVALHGVLDQP